MCVQRTLTAFLCALFSRRRAGRARLWRALGTVIYVARLLQGKGRAGNAICAQPVSRIYRHVKPNAYYESRLREFETPRPGSWCVGAIELNTKKVLGESGNVALQRRPQGRGA